MKDCLNILNAVLVTIGSVIGAGFISGSELICFFGNSYFLPAVYTASILFFGSILLLITLGQRYKGFDNMNKVFLRGLKTPINIILLFSSLIIVASMLAGIDSLIKSSILPTFDLPIFSILTLVLTFFVSSKGVNGVTIINLVLVPLILSFILFFLLQNKSFEYNFSQNGDYFKSAVSCFSYVGMNIFLASPVICDLGAKIKKGKTLTALITSIILAVSITLILASIYFEGANAINSDMPLLYILSGGGKVWLIIFIIISYFGILTTLLSSYYPLHNFCMSHKYSMLLRILVCLTAFGISRLGLKPIVNYLYPFLGIVGAIFLIYCGIKLYFISKKAKGVLPLSFLKDKRERT